MMNKLEKAKQIITQALKTQHPSSNTVDQFRIFAERADISWKTFQTAKQELNIEAFKEGDFYYWKFSENQVSNQVGKNYTQVSKIDDQVSNPDYSQEIWDYYCSAYKTEYFETATLEQFEPIKNHLVKFIRNTNVKQEMFRSIIKYYLRNYDDSGFGKKFADLINIDGNKSFIWERCLQNATKPEATKNNEIGNYWNKQSQVEIEILNDIIFKLTHNDQVKQKALLKLIQANHSDVYERAFRENWTNRDYADLTHILCEMKLLVSDGFRGSVSKESTAYLLGR